MILLRRLDASQKKNKTKHPEKSQQQQHSLIAAVVTKPETWPTRELIRLGLYTCTDITVSRDSLDLVFPTAQMSHLKRSVLFLFSTMEINHHQLNEFRHLQGPLPRHFLIKITCILIDVAAHTLHALMMSAMWGRILEKTNNRTGIWGQSKDPRPRPPTYYTGLVLYFIGCWHARILIYVL